MSKIFLLLYSIYEPVTLDLRRFVLRPEIKEIVKITIQLHWLLYEIWLVQEVENTFKSLTRTSSVTRFEAILVYTLFQVGRQYFLLAFWWQYWFKCLKTFLLPCQICARIGSFAGDAHFPWIIIRTSYRNKNGNAVDCHLVKLHLLHIFLI